MIAQEQTPKRQVFVQFRPVQTKRRNVDPAELFGAAIAKPRIIRHQNRISAPPGIVIDAKPS